MMNRPRAIALLCVLFLCQGCLEFDGQDVCVRYDAAADRVDAMFVYRGLFVESGNGSSNEPAKKAMQDLDRARENGEVAFWNNWPLAFDLTRDYQAPVKALLAHVDVETGGLFTDPKGILCGFQFVRVRNAEAFVQKVNTMFELAAQAALVGGKSIPGVKHQFDDDTKENLREFLRSGAKLLTVEAGRIELRLPLSAKDHTWFKGALEQHFVDNMPREAVRKVAVVARRAGGGDVMDTQVVDASVQLPGDQLAAAIRQTPSYRFFWDNDWSLQRAPELTTIALGVRGAEELRVVKANEGIYHDRLLTLLRERGDTIEDGLPEQEILRRFAAFRGRDAKLPDKVAAMRQKGAPAVGGDGK